MHILGLDFGTKTGVAFGNAGAPPARITVETWALPSGGAEDVGPIMHALRVLLYDRVLRGVELVVFEAPFVAKVVAPNQIRRAYGFAAMCEEVCHARGVQVLEAVPITLKKELTGHGSADKADMMRAARRRGFTIANDHEADAVAAWLYGVRLAAREHLHLYDPVFIGGSRG